MPLEALPDVNENNKLHIQDIVHPGPLLSVFFQRVSWMALYNARLRYNKNLFIIEAGWYNIC